MTDLAAAAGAGSEAGVFRCQVGGMSISGKYTYNRRQGSVFFQCCFKSCEGGIIYAVFFLLYLCSIMRLNNKLTFLISRASVSCAFLYKILRGNCKTESAHSSCCGKCISFSIRHKAHA